MKLLTLHHTKISFLYLFIASLGVSVLSFIILFLIDLASINGNNNNVLRIMSSIVDIIVTKFILLPGGYFFKFYTSPVSQSFLLMFTVTVLVSALFWVIVIYGIIKAFKKNNNQNNGFQTRVKYERDGFNKV